MDSPRYNYEPLVGPHGIRVLVLKGTKTSIEIQLRHFAVSSCTYEALSYVWGDPSLAASSKATVLDSRGNVAGWIPLTANLGNALRDLRDSEQLTSKVFWIDQICINQEDETEKSQQVAMMSRIYTQASRVITYLGPAGPQEDEDRGIRLLKRICEPIQDKTWHQMHKAGSVDGIPQLIQRKDIRFRPLPSDLALRDDKSYDETEVARRYVD
jgi:hypothetical protein